jgi:hypothetical protein
MPRKRKFSFLRIFIRKVGAPALSAGQAAGWQLRQTRLGKNCRAEIKKPPTTGRSSFRCKSVL